MVEKKHVDRKKAPTTVAEIKTVLYFKKKPKIDIFKSTFFTIIHISTLQNGSKWQIPQIQNG